MASIKRTDNENRVVVLEDGDFGNGICCVLVHRLFNVFIWGVMGCVGFILFD
jgi:hypothetical protein